MCVSTHEYYLNYLMLGKKTCFATGDHGKILLLPPPTESRRLLEITEKTQEIQQPQLGQLCGSRIFPCSPDADATFGGGGGR